MFKFNQSILLYSVLQLTGHCIIYYNFQKENKKIKK